MTQYMLPNAAAPGGFTVFAGPQLHDPNVIEVDESDARYVGWLAMQSGLQAFAQAMRAGVNITSTGTPALNGTYAIDQGSLSLITGEQVFIGTTGKFTNGQATRNWRDITGGVHLFPSTAEFTAFAEAVAGYADALDAALSVVQAGGAWIAPPMPSAIA